MVASGVTVQRLAAEIVELEPDALDGNLVFEQLGTLRRKLIQRAGRLTRPQGKLTLTMSANPAVESELLHYLDVLENAA